MKLMIVVMLYIGATGPYYEKEFKVGDGNCYEKGYEMLQKISTYHATYDGKAINQGWYTNAGNLVWGWYCK